MKYSPIVTPKVADGFVSRQTNLGTDSYDLDELYSPDTDQWRSKVLDLGSPKYPPQVATAPTHYWFDRSRYNNHGTIVGATWKQLPSGVWVLTFTGGDDLINLDVAVASLAAATQGTIEFWARMPDVTPAATQAIISFGDTQAPIELLTAWITTTGNPFLYCQDAGVLKWNLRIDGTPISDNTWFHFVGVQNGVLPVLYLNGAIPAQTFTTDVDRTPWFASLSNLDNGRLGCYNIDGAGNTAFFTGDIGGVRIYNRALTAVEVRHIYLATRWRYQ